MKLTVLAFRAQECRAGARLTACVRWRLLPCRNAFASETLRRLPNRESLAKILARLGIRFPLGDEDTTEVVRPTKELRAFRKIELKPGESATVKFKLEGRDLSYYDAHEKRWVSTPGRYRLYVGSSSQDVRLQQSVEAVEHRDPHAPPPEQAPLSDLF